MFLQNNQLCVSYKYMYYLAVHMSCVCISTMCYIHVPGTVIYCDLIFPYAQLKDAVCSPAGASIQAIQVLEKAGFRGLMMEAVQTASKRASELSRIENGEKQDYSLKRR